jgi:hypothetical protein
MMWNKRQVVFDLVLFSLVCLFLGLVVEPKWVYHSFGTIILDAPVFSTGGTFAWASLALPGGCISYGSGFLSQGYASSWLGSLIIAVTAWCLYSLLRWHLAYAGLLEARILASVPVVLILMVYNRYQHPLTACLTVSMGLLFSLVFEKVPWRGPLVRTGIYGLMAVAGYWLMGTGGLAIFALLTTIYSLLVRRQWTLGVAALPAGAAIIWILADRVFDMSPKQAFLVLTPFSQNTLKGMKTIPWVWIVALYAFAPVALLFTAAWKRIGSPQADGQTARTHASRPKKTPGAYRSKGTFLGTLKRLALPGLAMAVGGLGLIWSFDSMNKQFVRMNALSRQGRWAEVLKAAHRLPRGAWNVFCTHDINRALFNTGRLPYEMFSFAQNPHALLLTDQEIESSLTLLKLCDIYLEMGGVNAAEKFASEFLVLSGPFGVILERLAWIHIIKGEPDTARVYLHALQQDLIWQVKAGALLDALSRGLQPPQAAQVQRLRKSVRPNGLFGADLEAILGQLLEYNPRNKMAFEYLMAMYLLTGQLDKIVANMERLPQFGYPDIPTHYEEAILLYYGLQGRKVELNRFPIKQETLQRYVEFAQLNNSMETTDPKAVLSQLAHRFGKSYFFYYRFRRVGSG